MENKEISDKELYKVQFEEDNEPKGPVNIKKMLFIFVPIVIILISAFIALMVITSKTPGLEKDRYQVYEGEEFQIKTKADRELLTFSSENEKVATVDESGNVKALKEGFAKIVVKHDRAKTETTIVQVIKEKEQFYFEEEEFYLSINQTKNIEIIGKYEGDLTWYSSDEKVASVNGGMVFAKGIGTAVITGETKSGLKDSVTVTVGTNNQKEEFRFYVSPVRISKYTKNPKIEIRTEPTDAQVSFTYKVADENILKVDAEGNIEAVNVGFTEIEIIASNGKKKVILAEVRW